MSPVRKIGKMWWKCIHNATFLSSESKLVKDHSKDVAISGLKEWQLWVMHCDWDPKGHVLTLWDVPYLSLKRVSVSLRQNDIISKVMKAGERIMILKVNLLTEAKPKTLSSFVLNLSNNPLPFILLGGVFVANSNLSLLRILMALLFDFFFFPPKWLNGWKSWKTLYLWICMGVL